MTIKQPNDERIFAQDLSIHKTKNYSDFKLFEYNREIVQDHVDALIESMTHCDDSHLNPILVTPDFYIINGQHRFHACKKLQWPVYYIVDYNYSHNKLFIHNTLHKSWTLNDIVNCYVNLEEKEYIKFNDFMKKYNINISVAKELLYYGRRGGEYSKILKSGKLIFNPSDEQIILIENYVNFRQVLNEQGFRKKSMVTSGGFVRAFQRFFSTEGIFYSRFIDRYITRGKIYTYYSSLTLHLQQMAQIYNHGIRIQDKVIIITSSAGTNKISFEKDIKS